MRLLFTLITAHPILKDIPSQILPLNWHGDRFEIPQGAIHLAKSQACDNQAFIYKKNILGLQFHLEMGKKSLEKIITHCGNQLQPNKYIQDKETIFNNILPTRQIPYTLLNNWLRL